MSYKKYQQLISFLDKNKISEEFALRCMEYLLLSSKDPGGRPQQSHYLYVGYRIRSIKEKSKKPLTNKEGWIDPYEIRVKRKKKEKKFEYY